MRIGLNAQLLNTGAGYRNAGVSVYSVQLLRALGAAAAGGETEHHFTAWINDPDFATAGVELVRSTLPLGRPPARIAWEQTRLPHELRRYRIELIHGLVNVLPLRTPAAGVVTVHDLSFVRLPETLPRVKRMYLRHLCAASAARAARVIAVSRQTADDLMTHFGVAAARIDVIPNGVDPAFAPGQPEAAAELRRMQGLSDGYILFVGTLEPRKNLAMLLKAYAGWLRHTADPVPLVLAGAQGWFYAHVFRLVQELALTDWVRFLGHVPTRDLPHWYQAATLFVYPSRLEGFGLPVLEAMACGTPVICSDAPSLLEVAGDAALVVARDEATGVHQLEAALTRVMRDATLRTELRRRGLQQAAGYSWARTAQLTLETYARVKQ